MDFSKAAGSQTIGPRSTRSTAFLARLCRVHTRSAEAQNASRPHCQNAFRRPPRRTMFERRATRCAHGRPASAKHADVSDAGQYPYRDFSKRSAGGVRGFAANSARRTRALRRSISAYCSARLQSIPVSPLVLEVICCIWCTRFGLSLLVNPSSFQVQTAPFVTTP